MKKMIEKAASLYIDLTEDINPEDIAVGKEVEDRQKQMLKVLEDVKKEVKNPKKFIKEGMEVVKENEEAFSTSFIEPYFDDFLNVLLLDLYKKKIIDKKEFEKLKKEYGKEGVDIYV